VLGVVSPTPNPQAGGLPLVSCPRLLIQYIRSYPPYLEAVSSIRNLSTPHAVIVIIKIIYFGVTIFVIGSQVYSLHILNEVILYSSVDFYAYNNLNLSKKWFFRSKSKAMIKREVSN
jgi:hypothetical protein